MSTFRIDEPNKPRKWVKTVDNEKGILTFSTRKDCVYSRGCGIVAKAEGQRLKFLFKEQYPELEYLTVDDGW